MTLIIIGVIIFVIGLVLVVAFTIEKIKRIINPIRKDNSDYRFIEVDNIKTRNIFKSQN